MNTPAISRHPRMGRRLLAATVLGTTLAFGAVGVAAQTPAPAPAGLTSLMTATPEEGFALAVKLSQKGVGTVQKDVEVRKSLRPIYSKDADSLIAVSHVIATHFQTVAAANNYWRK